MMRHHRFLVTVITALLTAFAGGRAGAQTPDASAPPAESAEPTAAAATEAATSPEASDAPSGTVTSPEANDGASQASPAGAPASPPEGPDNSAVAINTKDGTDLFRLAFSVDRVMSTAHDDPDNAAVAYSSCNACETTAIAVQVVISSTPPEGESSPSNIALAINENCSSCETVALAYQIVMYSDEPVKLSKDGRERVKGIVQQMRDLEDQDLPPDQLNTQMDSLVGELAQVYQEELEPKHSDVNERSETEQGDTDPSDSLPSPDMTTSPEDSVDLGDSPAPDDASPPATTGSPDAASSAPSSADPSDAPEATP